MGLIARHFEAEGLPTVTLSSAWSITARAQPPRSAFLDYPLGHTAGPPHDVEAQAAIARAALALLETAAASGEIVALPYAWPEPWKAAAGRSGDYRSDRVDAPTYQEADDRERAIARHGEAVAVRPAPPETVPVD